MWVAFLNKMPVGELTLWPRGDPSGYRSQKGKGPEAGSGQECREQGCRKKGTQTMSSGEKRWKASGGEGLWVRAPWEPEGQDRERQGGRADPRRLLQQGSCLQNEQDLETVRLALAIKQSDQGSTRGISCLGHQATLS